MSRDELGGDQVEGLRAVRELLKRRSRRVRDIWMSDIADRNSPLVAEILDLAREQRVPIRDVSRSRLDAVAGTRAPQGVIAHAAPVADVDLEDLVRPRSARAAQPMLVVLEGVTDPRNLGAVLRSAEGAGATGVVLPRHRAAHLTPTATKASAGAIEYLPIALVAGIPSALQTLGKAGVWTVGLDGDAPGSIFDLELATEPVALVLGSEGGGLSRLARQRCDALVSIPQLGGLSSLNVASAAAVACYEVARRRLRN
jgi:23S rRNA (guanosine2251-2'-O)-methyltransferase